MTGRRRAPLCAPGGIERGVQAAVGALVAAFALGSLHDPPLAVATALGAALLVTGAVRGRCPASLLAGASTPTTVSRHNALGIPEARQPIDP
ncbi:YgaP family membrane protein [Agrococcus sp. DT81.2]|uniref:YgaP family membrane protein n=1 Tax=Agrococcus sp. DT81.2 TaxID=3393414 RepID=UPI003CE4CCBD